jgi:hypothetical protein
MYTVVYYGDDLTEHKHKPSVYLDGPKGTVSKISWRKRLLETFTVQGYEHVIIVPECRDNNYRPPYGTKEFYEWEDLAMNMATMIMFWIPRDSTLFTGKDINDRWGYWKQRKNVILGYPERAEDVGYQKWYADTYGITVVKNLENMVVYAKEQLHQFAKLEFTMDNGAITLPYDENVLNNDLLRKMVARMERQFLETVTTINVHPDNMSAMEHVNRVTRNAYTLSTVNNGLIVFTRRADWESLFTNQIPSGNDNNIVNDEQVTVPALKEEDAETLRMLIDLRKKLKITDADLEKDTPQKRNGKMLDGENMMQ